FGLVDNDASTQARIAALRSQNVYPLEVYSVESIYYHPEVQELVGRELSAVVGDNLAQSLESARCEAIDSVERCKEHLSLRIAEKVARAKVFSVLPSRDDMKAGKTLAVEVDLSSYARDELERLKSMIDAGDLAAILKRYPV